MKVICILIGVNVEVAAVADVAFEAVHGVIHNFVGGRPVLGFKVEIRSVGRFVTVSLCRDAASVRRKLGTVNSCLPWTAVVLARGIKSGH